MSTKLSKDRPISRAEEDVFGLSGFADALATSLQQMSPGDGLVLSVANCGRVTSLIMTPTAMTPVIVLNTGAQP